MIYKTYIHENPNEPLDTNTVGQEFTRLKSGVQSWVDDARALVRGKAVLIVAGNTKPLLTYTKGEEVTGTLCEGTLPLCYAIEALEEEFGL